MSHHGDGPLSEEFEKEADERIRIMLAAMKDAHLKDALGPTGKHPEGKLVPYDEGELTFAVGIREGKVTIEFGGPVKWFGMNPSQARQLADLLVAKADQAQLIQPNERAFTKKLNKLLQKTD